MQLYNTILKRKYKELGLVEGNIVKSRFMLRDFIAGIKKKLGFEITEYTELMNELRAKAKERMIEQAETLGADAIINIRYSTSMITYEAGELLVYGTAVKFDVYG